MLGRNSTQYRDRSMRGIKMVHGCNKLKHFFVSEETIQNSCAMLCPNCGSLINFSMFGSSIKEQLLKQVEVWPESEIGL
jgi:hypothetical protein